MTDTISLHHCLKNKQLKLNAFSGKDPVKRVFNIMHTSTINVTIIKTKLGSILNWKVRLILHMTDHTPMLLYNLLYRKEMAYTLQPFFLQG